MSGVHALYRAATQFDANLMASYVNYSKCLWSYSTKNIQNIWGWEERIEHLLSRPADPSRSNVISEKSKIQSSVQEVSSASVSNSLPSNHGPSIADTAIGSSTINKPLAESKQLSLNTDMLTDLKDIIATDTGGSVEKQELFLKSCTETYQTQYLSQNIPKHRIASPNSPESTDHKLLSDNNNNIRSAFSTMNNDVKSEYDVPNPTVSTNLATEMVDPLELPRWKKGDKSTKLSEFCTEESGQPCNRQLEHPYRTIDEYREDLRRRLELLVEEN